MMIFGVDYTCSNNRTEQTRFVKHILYYVFCKAHKTRSEVVFKRQDLVTKIVFSHTVCHCCTCSTQYLPKLNHKTLCIKLKKKKNLNMISFKINSTAMFVIIFILHKSVNANLSELIATSCN